MASLSKERAYVLTGPLSAALTLAFLWGGKFPLKNGLLPHHLLSLLMPLKLILMLYLCFGK